MNISPGDSPELKISKFLSLIGQPARIQILLVIREQEACVCHLEAALGMRQASISQHLMVLRKAGLVMSHRDGRNIFYRLVSIEIVNVILQSARLAGIVPERFDTLSERPVPGCCCPQCNPGLDPDLTCQVKRAPSPAANPQ